MTFWGESGNTIYEIIEVIPENEVNEYNGLALIRGTIGSIDFNPSDSLFIIKKSVFGEVVYE